MSTVKKTSGEIPRRQDYESQTMALTIEPAELSDNHRDLFDKCTEKLGFIPNVLASYALL
jgi:uncharacterized protein YeeX (DUF496 family)